MRKFKCCDCRKDFFENKVLATGFNDCKGDTEVICHKCEKKRNTDFYINDNL
jgi:hypothetical protein